MGTDKDMLTPLFFSWNCTASSAAVYGGHLPRRQKGGAEEVTLRCHIGVYCTGHKTHRDKLPISYLLLMERQVSSITHIRMQVVWARRGQTP